MRLTGLLFIYPISIREWQGPLEINTTTFQKLCGSDAFHNVIITSTMWDDVDEKYGSAKETALRNKHWKTMISCGARTARFHFTYSSAWDIIDQFSGDRSALQLQREVVDQGKSLMQTAAASTLLKFGRIKV
jgi:hypothetical protein